MVQWGMGSKQQNVDFVLEQLSLAGVSARKMFGEYAIYVRDKVVALFCDDQLFIKPTNAGRAFIGKVTEAPPYPGAKPCFLVSGDRCEDAEWLSALVKLTAGELPAPKKKSPKSAKAAAKTAPTRAKKSLPSARKSASAKPAQTKRKKPPRRV
jgi:DNA transformation protein and related proteins